MIISNNQNTKISKFLSLVLRHKPETIQLKLDDNGWAGVDELIEKLNNNGTEISFETLEYVVETNSKKRFAFNQDKSKIRASQGHSLKVDLRYQPIKPPKKLYHGTSIRFLDSILKTGIEKRDRQHVHLSSNRKTALKVGQRHGKPTILEVQASKMHDNGYSFYLSENKVWLTEYIPIEYIKLIESVNKTV